MVERTLRAARAIRHAGPYDVWLLDEGDDAEVRRCARGSACTTSPAGACRSGTPASGAFKAKTKHGNYNSWMDRHGDDYDVFVSVDPDHVPLPNFCERLLGYFRDPDVAFVVGPQIYGNYDNVVTRWAESQQYLFHSLLQRAGNRLGIADAGRHQQRGPHRGAAAASAACRTRSPRTWRPAWPLHAARNPATGQRWRSVYTPDVLAVGEGPSSWTDYFSQQHRWSRGTDEVVVRRVRPGDPAARRPAGAALRAADVVLPADRAGLAARLPPTPPATWCSASRVCRCRSRCG